MADLSTNVKFLAGIGEKKAQALGKLGVFTLSDLLSFFPRTYEDRTQFRPIAMCMEDETVCIQAMVATEPRLNRVRRGMELVKFRVVDDSDSLDVTFFNQTYMRDRFRVGETYHFYGKVTVAGRRRGMTNPVFEPACGQGQVTGRIMPVYRLSAGLSQAVVSHAVRQALDDCVDLLPEALPESLCRKYKLASTRYAFENIHFPDDFQALESARRRLIFEELFLLACALGSLRDERVKGSGIRLPEATPEDFYAALPFRPTGAQQRAVEEAFRDMCSGGLMNRLVQGDVGSGKTMVAAACIWLACRAGFQAAFMAPTEILAEQHVETLRGFLEPMGVQVRKCTGSMTAKQKREVRDALLDGSCGLVVGTHALLGDEIGFKNLALVVTDEQHRFGVEQRAALAAKSGAKPHVLVMSATPIPRTLALIIYGDLDVSVIDELPPGRQKVDTFAVDESYRPRINAFIRKQVGLGRQVFVVCPMIEENEELPPGLKPVEEHVKDLRAQFPDLVVEAIHGKLKAKEKDSIMSTFLAGGIHILVSTTVIEVGVDVPNASLMVVENAERFGLSQLHQLRGRVGRGQHKSYCILVSDAKNQEARARLSVMTKTNDGFKIAEEDLRIRGPGDFFGSRQHGLPQLNVADLCTDARMLKVAQDEALALLETDPKLCKPENAQLRKRVDALIHSADRKFN